MQPTATLRVCRSNGDHCLVAAARLVDALSLCQWAVVVRMVALQALVRSMSVLQADIRWQHANGQMNGHMEPDQFFGGMPGFPNMSMGPQMGMGMGPPMGMGMGMGPMGMGMMNPMAMQMPMMPGRCLSCHAKWFH